MSPGFRTTLVYLGLLSAAVLAGVWFMRNFELVPSREWVGPSGEARSNPVLAAQRTLELMGREARSVSSLYAEPALPPVDATIFLYGSRSGLSAEQHARLLAWTEAGGHLVVTSVPALDWSTPARDPFFERLGITVRPPSDAELERPEVQDVAPEELGPCCEEDSPPELIALDDAPAGPVEYEAVDRAAFVIFPGTQEYLIVDLGSPYELEDVRFGATWRVDGERHALLLRRAVGRGLVTAVATLDFIGNDVLDDFDHAELLWRLVRERPGPVWLVYAAQAPHWLAALARHAWPALSSFALCLVAFLWQRSVRVGPLIAPPASRRRGIMEHVEASGRFLYDHGFGHLLVAAAQRRVRTALIAAHPSLRDAVAQQKVEVIARATGQDARDLAALFMRGDAQSLAATLASLERISRRP